MRIKENSKKYISQKKKTKENKNIFEIKTF